MYTEASINATIEDNKIGKPLYKGAKKYHM